MNIEDIELLKEDGEYRKVIHDTIDTLSTYYGKALSHGINILVFENLKEMDGEDFITLDEWKEPYEEYILSKAANGYKEFEFVKVYRQVIKMLQEEFQGEIDPLVYEMMEKTLEYFLKEYSILTITNELLYDLLSQFEYIDNIQVLHILILVYGVVLFKKAREIYDEKYRKDFIYHILDNYKPIGVQYLTQQIPSYETKDDLYKDIAHAVSKSMSYYIYLDKIEELYDYPAAIIDDEDEYDYSAYGFIKLKIYLVDDIKELITGSYKPFYFYQDIHYLEELMFRVACTSYLLQKDFLIFDEKINQIIRQLVKEIEVLDKKYRKHILDATHKVEEIMVDIVFNE